MPIARRTLLASLAAATSVVAITTSRTASAAKTEEPAYKVVKTFDDFEVRKYAPRIVAEVQVRGDARDASRAGFRLLADFIFGNNTTRSQVAMTAPVDRSEAIEMTAPVDRAKTEAGWTIAFTMPSAYTLDTLPRPNNDRVRIRQLAATRYAVMRFSGSPKEPRVRERMTQLRELVDDAGLTATDKPITYARYDPPWTPGFLRRNELLLELATPSLSGGNK